MKLLPRDLLPGSLPRGVESRVISALVSRQISIPRGSSLVNGEHAREAMVCTPAALWKFSLPPPSAEQ